MLGLELGARILMLMLLSLPLVYRTRTTYKIIIKVQKWKDGLLHQLMSSHGADDNIGKECMCRRDILMSLPEMVSVELKFLEWMATMTKKGLLVSTESSL
jgi:hypothetical protein